MSLLNTFSRGYNLIILKLTKLIISNFLLLKLYGKISNRLLLKYPTLVPRENLLFLLVNEPIGKYPIYEREISKQLKSIL